VRIRPATEDDLEALLDVNRAAALSAYRAIFGAEPFPTARVRTRYRRLLSDRGCRIVLAEDQEQVIGFVAARADCLEALYVVPSAWGRGVGSRLYEVAEPLLAATATLWVLEANARGRRFWEHRGWQPDGDRKREHGSKVELRYRRDPRTTTATRPRSADA
jgi:GNAT superfamily N-acetyltransferase